MTFDENTPFLGDDFEGDTVTLVSNIGGRKDRHFARNYAWAKHAADRGQLRSIVVNIVANGETYRTVDAFKRAVGSPHKAVRVNVTHTVRVEHAREVADAVAALMPAPSKDAGKPAPAREKPAQTAKPAPVVEPASVPDSDAAQNVAAVTDNETK